MIDNFEFTLDSNFRGYLSAKDKTLLASDYLVRGSINVYKKLSGTIASRFGLKRRGTADATLAPVKSSFEFYTSYGRTLPLRVCNGSLQVESDIADGTTLVWYDLLTGLTLTRFVFDTWWDDTAKKDICVFVNGDSDLKSWSGGIAVIGATTVNTITLDDTASTWQEQGFSTTGSVIIGGNTYTYSGGSTTNTLTGVSGDPTGEPAGSVAVQTVVTNTNKPASGFTADFLKNVNNQLYIGSYTSRFIYVSNDTDYTDYTVPSPREVGDPEIIVLDNLGKGITTRNGNTWISAGLSDWYEITFTEQSFGSLTSPITVQITNRKKIPTATLSAAYAHEFIDNVGNDIVYLAQDQEVRVIGDFKNYFQTKFPTISQDVYTELPEEDFDGGHLRAIGDFIYITAPNTGRMWLYQSRETVDDNGNIVGEKLWHAPFVINLSRLAVIDGVIYGHSNANPQIYQIWDTGQWHDDSPSDDPIPYVSIARFAYQRVQQKGGARRQGKLRFNKVYLEGYIANGVPLNGNVYMDYQGSASQQALVFNSIESPAVFYSGASAPTIGSKSLGDNPLGDGLTPESNDQELLNKFRVICNINPISCYEFELEVYCAEPESRWEILAIGANMQEVSEQAVELTR